MAALAEGGVGGVTAVVEGLYRNQSRRVFSTLIRLLGDFDRAEEALHDAFRAALEQWPRDGVPAQPSAWRVSTGRFKAIDNLRRRGRRGRLGALEDPDALADPSSEEADADDHGALADDHLRPIFTCCHPALGPDAQVALTVVLAMRDGPAAGLALVDALRKTGERAAYRLAHAILADFCRRLGPGADARNAYQRALALTRQGPERWFLERRRVQLEG